MNTKKSILSSLIQKDFFSPCKDYQAFLSKQNIDIKRGIWYDYLMTKIL